MRNAEMRRPCGINIAVYTQRCLAQRSTCTRNHKHNGTYNCVSTIILAKRIKYWLMRLDLSRPDIISKMKTREREKERENEKQGATAAASGDARAFRRARSRDNIPEEILGRQGTRVARYLLALVRGHLERNEMLPRKLDRTGTNAHTSIGVHREPGCTDQRVLPTICRLWPRTSSPSMLLTRRGRFNYRHN